MTALRAGAAAAAAAALVVAGARAATRVDRFDEQRAFAFLRTQVELGPRPAGSAASLRLRRLLLRRVPRARLQPLPDGLANVIGFVPGGVAGRVVVLGAHYDTKDLPGFVGANDGASGTAVLVELARTLRPRSVRPTVIFAFFDGEETPRGIPGSAIETAGLRGSRAAVPILPRAEAMILLDFVGDRDLELPREANSDRALWQRLRRAARKVGAAEVFPPRVAPPVLDDHLPFARAGIPAVDLIDFDFPCFHRRCDDLAHVSAASLDAVGETVLQFLRDA